MYLYLLLGVPLLGIIIMSFFGHSKISGLINIILTLSTFISSLFLVHDFLIQGPTTFIFQQFYLDSFNLLYIVLTTFIATTTALFSNKYMLHNIIIKRITKRRLRLYYAMYQAFCLAMLLSLTANNIGILWVAMESATLATVLLVSLYRTPEAIEAAWKYFILCIVGIALALFGTILIYFSASQVDGITANNAILWSKLHSVASLMDKKTITLAFVFLLIGYGTKTGLAPLHNWLPDTYSESPAPISALLSGALSSIALYALIRFKILVDASLNSHLTGNLLMGFGLLSFLVGVILLFRQRNIKRLFAYSSIEHFGLITFAFGIGGQLMTLIALVYTAVHALIKSALFLLLGGVIQLTGTQNMEKIRSLIRTVPKLGWALLVGTIAICGLPPFAIFTCEVMLFISTIHLLPWVTVLLLFGLITACAGLFKNLHPVFYGEPSLNEEAAKTDHTLFSHSYNKITVYPSILSLLIVAILGVYFPPLLNNFLQQSVALIAK